MPINIFLNIILQLSRFTLLRRQSDASRVPASESAPAASRSVYQAFGPLTRGLDIAARFWQGSESRLCHLCVSLISLSKSENISQKCAFCQQTLLGYAYLGAFQFCPGTNDRVDLFTVPRYETAGGWPGPSHIPQCRAAAGRRTPPSVPGQKPAAYVPGRPAPPS